MKKIEKIKIGFGDTYAMVSPVGATVTEFVWQGIDVIFPQTKIGDKIRGGIPVCFPFFGKMGHPFQNIPQHGWLRNQELKKASVDKNKVALWGFNEPCEEYPWFLEYEIVIEIGSVAGLLLSLFVSRKSDGIAGAAPVNPAFHPYFKNHLGRPTVFSRDEKLAHFQDKASIIPAQKITEIKTGKAAVRMIIDGAFSAGRSALVLWSDLPEKYFCVEPVLVNPLEFGKKQEWMLGQGEVLKMECLLSVSKQNESSQGGWIKRR